MALNLEKLMKYDLVDDIEAKMRDPNDKKYMKSFFDFFNAYQQINIEDQFIRESPAYPGSTDKILRNELVSSIGATLAIEGTNLTKEEIEESLQKADLKESLEKKEQEAQNSRNAYEYIRKLVYKRKDKFTYNEKHIKHIHKCITENIDYIGNAPGQYRDINPIFGEPPRRSLCKTKTQVELAMSKLIYWLNKPEESGLLRGNIIVKAIMAHYYLVEIHPFGDGNGRTARAVEALILYVNRINIYCFWSLANFWSANRNEYIVHLGNIRATCNPWDFLMWGVEGYLKEIQRIKGLVLKKAKKLMLMDYVRWLFSDKKHQKGDKRINQRIVGILALLTQRGKMPLDKLLSSPELMTLYHKRTAPTRYRDFDKMVNSKLIRISKKDKTIEPNYQLLDSLEYQV
ncbi:MAG: Fic family protein [Planctomycetota bacterium]|jgi:fido (protein-threonine AMPylation protein)